MQRELRTRKASKHGMGSVYASTTKSSEVEKIHMKRLFRAGLRLSILPCSTPEKGLIRLKLPFLVRGVFLVRGMDGEIGYRMVLIASRTT